MYYFFLHSQHNNNDEYLADVHDCHAVRTRSAEMAQFFQPQFQRNSRGSFPKTMFLSQLSTSRTFVAMATGPALSAALCGKEWAAFHDD